LSNDLNAAPATTVSTILSKQKIEQKKLYLGDVLLRCMVVVNMWHARTRPMISAAPRKRIPLSGALEPAALLLFFNLPSLPRLNSFATFETTILVGQQLQAIRDIVRA